MPRGVVLPFPPHGLTQKDCEGLTGFAATRAGVEVEIFAARGRQRVAIITVAGQQFWVERGAVALRLRAALKGHLLAEGDAIGPLLSLMHAALLPGGMAVWGYRTGSLG